jgi:hypothetical protein
MFGAEWFVAVGNAGDRLLGRDGALRTQQIGFRKQKAPLCGAFQGAPERTRTSTDHTVHKALNLIRRASMPISGHFRARLGALVAVLDVLEGVDVATSVATVCVSATSMKS